MRDTTIDLPVVGQFWIWPNKRRVAVLQVEVTSRGYRVWLSGRGNYITRSGWEFRVRRGLRLEQPSDA